MSSLPFRSRGSGFTALGAGDPHDDDTWKALLEDDSGGSKTDDDTCAWANCARGYGLGFTFKNRASEEGSGKIGMAGAADPGPRLDLEIFHDFSTLVPIYWFLPFRSNCPCYCRFWGFVPRSPCSRPPRVCRRHYILDISSSVHSSMTAAHAPIKRLL
ncbi:hypothetical protein GALMADRAFT_1050176 [Galerina marginata CBS 339.88]|uniref:Uncharacterized protein n=1 Tax=Galerina marginata (strain CBS 339.88) TaxID=685588 RepID=A0A067SKQ7_GALM3|nr:hypothetical protein GALMADRAFT_1050176 [Galerina marginata CBS 339.88]